MSSGFRLLMSIAIVITFLVFGIQVKKKKLELQYTITWLFLLFILLLVTLFPHLLNWITSLLGIELPINMVFFLGFVFTLLIVYRLTLAISKQSRQLTALTQEIALLKKKVEEKES